MGSMIVCYFLLVHYLINGCSPAICPPGTTNFTTNPEDKCPVCDLGESYRREPCSSSDHCPMKLGCSQSKNCHYSKKPGTSSYFAKFCQFQFDCPAFQVCSKEHRCRADDSVAFHLKDEGCQVDDDCGEHFECDQEQHTCSAKDNYCENDKMCRTGWSCEEDGCVEVGNGEDKAHSPDKCDCKECTTRCGA